MNPDFHEPELEEFDQPESLIGREVGAFRLTEEIGRGGMGAVFLAERADGEFEQKVAVKLIKRGMDTDFVLKRFRHERQILASLNHPYIARLLGGGTTKDGLPYFVMEYIEGKTLFDYADSNNLNLSERIELFRKICDAIAFAHQSKVVHRDLKPSNILVKADGTPKLLDFGIAKILDPELAAETLLPTATQMRLMTAEYASPEQVRGLEVTPASDIYSAGVLLFQLVTGERPYHFASRAPHEIARVICETEPARPSSFVLSPLPKKNSTDSSGQRTSRDLDNVILKALRKDPAARYASIADFSDDLKRFLDNEPVKAEAFISSASPQNEARRQTVEQSSLAVLPLKTLTPATGDTGDSYLGIGLADTLITRLSQLNRFIVRPTSSVLRFGETTHDPVQAGRELSVHYVLDGNFRRAGNRLRVSLQLLDVKTSATVWAQQFDENAEDVLELEDAIAGRVAEAIVPQLTGEERERLARRGTNSGEAYEAYLRGRFYWNLSTEEGFAKAIKLYERAIEIDPNFAQAYAAIADYYIHLGIHCVLPFSECSARAKEAAGKAIGLDPQLAEAQASYGFLLTHDYDWESAETYLRRAIELNPNTATARQWLNATLLSSGRFDEAMEQAKRIFELEPDSPLGLHFLAWTHYHRREFAESLKIHERMMAGEPLYAWGRLTFSWTLRAVGEFARSIEQAQKAVELAPGNTMYLTGLAAAYAAAGSRDEALKTLAQIYEMDDSRYVSPFMFAVAYCALGDIGQALDWLERAFETGDTWLVWLGVDPQFEPLRRQARYFALLRRINPKFAGRQQSAIVKTKKSDEQKSIAVLPLRFIGSPSVGDEYLGIGLADAMITRLSNMRRLIVRPTSAVLSFGEMTDPFAAGQKLSVDLVLDGTIRRVGTRVRISAQLLDVNSISTRWAETYDEDFTDVLDLEDLVAEKVVKMIVPRLTGEEKLQLARRGTNNPEAYEAYLRGRYHLYLITPESFNKARFYFERAITLDPDYALAFAGLADCYFAQGTFAASSPLAMYKRAREMATRAIELDPSLGEPFAVLGFVTFSQEFDFSQAEKILRRGIELSPNYALGRIWLSVLLNAQGRTDEAILEARRAAELNPTSGFDLTHYAWILYHSRRFDEAVAQMRRMLQSDPIFSHGLGVMSWILRHVGQYEESLVLAKRAADFSNGNPWLVCNLAAIYARVGQTEQARSLLKELEAASAESFVSPYNLAVAYVNLGEIDKAFENLEKAYEARDVWFIWLPTDPQMDALRRDPRYSGLIAKMKSGAP